MRAVRIHETGGPDVVRYEEAPDPEPGPGEVLVELRAAGVNRRDILVRSGVYDFDLPLVPGGDGAGVRRDTGEEVVLLPIVGWGDRDDRPGPYVSLGGPLPGTYAELIAVPEENVFPKPRRLSFEEAAALPIAGLTAYRALFVRAKVEAGETVLVLGIGSGVGTYALMLAREAGARVIVTSSSADKLERARALGAEAGLNYTEGDWVEAARELTGEGVDVVLDGIGASWWDSLRALRPGGRAVVFGATAGKTAAELQVRPFYFGQYSLLGSSIGSPREFGAFLETVERADWSPVIDSVRPLAEAAAAHERLEAGEHFGKLVLSIS